jgi:hypothetical protein
VEENWAWPCVPYAGAGVGFAFLPPRGANVWIEFEGGSPDHPVWSGCFWTLKEHIPAEALIPTMKVLQTDNFKLVISDVEGVAAMTLTVSTQPPVTISINALGVKIQMEPTSITLDPKSVCATVAETKATITPTGVSVDAAPGEVTVMAQKVGVTAAQVQITGETTVNSPTTIVGPLTCNTGATITGQAAVTGELAVSGMFTTQGPAASVQAPLTVGAPATFMAPMEATVIQAAELTAVTVTASAVLAPNNLM